MQGGSASTRRGADSISRGHRFNDRTIIILVRVIGHYCEDSGLWYDLHSGFKRRQPLITGLRCLAIFPPWLVPGIRTLIKKEMGS